MSTIGLGLLVHRGSPGLSPSVRDVLGDALWAMMIVWWIGFAVPNSRPWRRAVVALLVCWVVEFSQLVHTPALDRFRGTSVGHLFLGSGFDPRDLVAYALGVGVAVLLEIKVRGQARFARESRPT